MYNEQDYLKTGTGEETAVNPVAAQNAFIKLYLRFDRYKDYSKKSQIALLYKMTRNSAIDLYRQKQDRSTILYFL